MKQTIQFNPVKHSLVRGVSDWEWSTFHMYVKQGVYLYNWCEEDVVMKLVDFFNDYYNKLQKRKIIEDKLKKESLLIKEDSMSVLKEFEGIENDY